MKKIIKKALRLRVFQNGPRGFDLPHNLKRFLPDWQCHTIFDVGANVGQSALEFSERFPNSEIHCFEPFPSTFETLVINTGQLPLVHCHPVALSSETSRIKVDQGECSTNNSILAAEANDHENQVEIETKTLDEMRESLGIGRISFLKIDTEGHDLEVLHGASESLSGNMIDVVQVEAGMNPTNTHHVTFEDLKRFLETKGFLLFGVYEQTGEFMSGHPAMRRANCVFISSKVNEQYRHTV
jgi:FkbM family methyltransferase